MKKVFVLFLLLAQVFTPIRAQQTLIISETRLPYTSQVWWTEGGSCQLSERKIRKNWDEGRQITSLAYTKQGWFVTMAKDTDLRDQQIKISNEWPEKWIRSNWASGHYITSMAYGSGEWAVVMSKGTDYKEQCYYGYEWTDDAQWIRQKWDEGFYITSATFNGKYWHFVMSRTAAYSSQGYVWANSFSAMQDKVSEKWDIDRNIQILEYGDGEYLGIYCVYADDNGRGQAYVRNPSSLKNYIQEKWDEDKQIAYIGGGPGSYTSSYSEEYTTGDCSNTYHRPSTTHTSPSAHPKSSHTHQQPPPPARQQPNRGGDR